MLHLAIIGLVCAVSAPSEILPLTEQKNNESNISHDLDEGGRNVANVTLPSVYDAYSHNSSTPAEEIFTKRTSSFFYEYFIKQYQDSKNSSCSVMDSVPSDKKKKFHSNLGSRNRKKRGVFSKTKEKGGKVSPKTLRPPSEKHDCQKEKANELIKKKSKIKGEADTKREYKSDLNSNEKKMFFLLKNKEHLKKRPSCGQCHIFNIGRGLKRHLDRLKVDDELDLNKRIEKLVKQIALENQRKETSAKELELIGSIPNGEFDGISFMETPSKKVEPFPFFNHIKKIFSFSKNYFNNKIADNVVNSVPVNIERGKKLVSDKAALISSYDVLKTMHKTNRIRRHFYKSHPPYRPNDNTVPADKNELNEKFHPHRAELREKKNLLHPRVRREFIPKSSRTKRHRHINKRRTNRRGRKIRNFKLFKKFNFHKPNSRLRRDNNCTSVNKSKGKLSELKKSNLSSDSKAPEAEKSSQKPKAEKQVSVTGDKNSPLFKKDEEIKANSSELQDNKKVIPFHTIERPYLGADFNPEFLKHETLKTGFEPITQVPVTKRRYEMRTEPLTSSRYLKIRHALRNYLIHNNVLAPYKRSRGSVRKKRCGMPTCSRPQKCWRSAPLLCLPYIKKCQEDQLKYIIKLLQNMLGKPFPPRLDIFERTKFKPTTRPCPDNGCDDNYEECTPEPPPCSTPKPMNCPPRPPPCPPFFPPLCPPPFPLPCLPPCPPPSPPRCPPPCPPPSPPPCPPPCPPPRPPPNLPPCPPPSPPPCPPSCPPPRPPPSPPPCPPPRPPPCPPNSPPTSSPPCPSSTVSPPSCPRNCGLTCATTPTCAKSTLGQTPFTSEAQQLPISFPVLGQVDDPTTSCCNCDDFTTALPPSSISVAPSCHTPTVPMPVTGSSPVGVTSSAASLRPSQATRSYSLNSSPSYTTVSPRLSMASVTTPFHSVLTPSSVNNCGIHNWDSPVERKEYFSFTAFSYNDVPDYATESYQYSESLTSRAANVDSLQARCNCNQKLYPQKSACDGCGQTPSLTSTTPRLQRPTPRPPFGVSRATQNSKTQVKGQSKNFRENKHSHPENFFGASYSRSDPRNRKINSNKRFNKAQLEDLIPYENQFIPPTERHSKLKYEISQNRLFKMHHRGNPRRYYRPMKTFPDYEYDFYDKYPEEKRRQNRIRFGDHPPLQSPWKDYEWKPKEMEKRGTKKRSKREDDYYFWPERFESYNDYFDNPNYSDEYLKRHPEADAKLAADSSWTPPSFDMFNELAKAVSQKNTSTLESEEKNSKRNESTTDSGETSLIQGTDSETYQTTTYETPAGDFSNVKNDTDNTKASLNTTETSTTTLLSSTSGLSSEGDFTCENDDIATRSNNTAEKSKDYKKLPTKCGLKSEAQRTTITNFTSEQTFPSATDHPLTTTDFVLEGKEVKEKQNSNSPDECQVPTTLKTASIAKGQKKLATKPCPKMYTKVYPDSVGNEAEVNERNNLTTGRTITTSTTTTTREKTMPTLYSTSPVDFKLQILAVCEGYLEVIKLVKAQNQTPGEDLDMDLARYCESIISQSFNSASEKPRKSEIAESSNLSGSMKFDENPQKSDLKDVYDAGNGSSEGQSAETDLPDDALVRKILAESVRKKSSRKKRLKNLDDPKTNFIEVKTRRSGKRKKKIKNSASSKNKQKRQQKTEDSEELIKKGVTQEQLELIKLLTKRKKALLSWLMNTKEREKSGDLQEETGYFDNEDLFEPSSVLFQDSGPIKPKRDEKPPGTAEKNITFVNESVYPVYAKQYGYQSGGEVREVEVLWRKINEKTHEKTVFKNLSVLALLLTSTNYPNVNREDAKPIGSNEYESEEVPEIQLKNENKVGYAAAAAAKCQKTTTALPVTSATSKVFKVVPLRTLSKKHMSSIAKSFKKNTTLTIITKPDASTFVGKPPSLNKTHSNATRKVGHRFGAAKDFFQEYSIEFLNYAVYILPIMFTILFLFCCLCCAVHILHTRKIHKKKRKKKIAISSEECTDETTEESEFESKKRKRDAKRKRKSKKDEASDSLEPSRSKKFWNVLNLHPSKPNRDGDEKSQTEKKKSFLRFLRGRRDGDKVESFCLPLCEADEDAKHSQNGNGKDRHDSDNPHGSWERKNEEEKRKTDGENEAAERRELIALLEELKKIETEHTEEKKEVKSVHVQYMTQEDENPVFQRPDFPYPYEKNVFGLPKGYSFCSKQIPFHHAEPAAVRDYELYDDVNELTELLPCECDYYSKGNEYCDFRMDDRGRCERFLKIFRDSDVRRSKPFVRKNCRKSGSENRTFIFNKYRSISTDESEGLIGVAGKKNAGTEVRFMENASPFKLPPKKNADLVEEMENFKRELNKKKNVHLKDEGVLCRL